MDIDGIKAKLITELEGIKNKIREKPELESMADELDLANDITIQAIEVSLQVRDLANIQKINNAVLRIEQGIYTICAKCEEEIEEKRLLARPTTVLCINCQEDQESDMKKQQVGL